MILHFRRCGVVVIVTSLSMVTKTMSVLDTEVKVLGNSRAHDSHVTQQSQLAHWIVADEDRQADQRGGHVVKLQPLIYIFIRFQRRLREFWL